MTADQVFISLGVVRPDVADTAIAKAVRSAVHRNLELLTDDGWLTRDGVGYTVADAAIFQAA